MLVACPHPQTATMLQKQHLEAERPRQHGRGIDQHSGREEVLAKVAQDASSLAYASLELRDDEDVVRAAMDKVSLLGRFVTRECSCTQAHMFLVLVFLSHYFFVNFFVCVRVEKSLCAGPSAHASAMSF